MYFWNAYPFVRFTLALITGMLGVAYFPFVRRDDLIIPLLIFLGVHVSLLVVARRTGYHRLRHLLGSFGLGTLLLIGSYIMYERQQLPQDHYPFNQQSIRAFQGTLVAAPTEREKYFRYTLALSYVMADTAIKTTGQIYLYVRKGPKQMSYGDIVRVKGAFFPVPPPKNPNEFDYKKYLARQDIYSHAFVSEEQVSVVGNKPPSLLFSHVLKLRKRVEGVIEKTIRTDKERAIAKALILGIKDHLDNDIKKAYAAAGAMHVLAVSGLHVGIVYLLIKFIFGFLRQRGPVGKGVFALLSILAIWGYALITGLSPSVLRAATMFSIVAMGQSNPGRGNIYNTLGVSAFILLVFDPHLLFSVGFQLSYAAVLGIVYLQPKLYGLFAVRHWILDKAWAITCVSIAAQLATFPLSLYYFHQFPTYFLISNMVVIPAAFVTLILGLFMVFIDPFWEMLGSLLGHLVSAILYLLNEVMGFVAAWPGSLMEWIYLDLTSLFLVYGAMICLLGALHFKSFQPLLIALSLIGCLIGFSFMYHAEREETDRLIFYEIKDQTVIDLVSGPTAKLYVEDQRQESIERMSYQINPFRLANGLPPIHTQLEDLNKNFHKIASFKMGYLQGKKILIFDTTSFHLDFLDTLYADVLLIENEAVKNMEWLHKHFVCDHIIIGNTNSYAYTKKIKKQADDLGVFVHDLSLDGAFILENGHKKRAN